MNTPELVVRNVNLFVDSTDRSRSFRNPDDGTLAIPLTNIPNLQCGPGQHIRLSLSMFSCPNQFDRTISPNNNFQIFIGSSVKTYPELVAVVPAGGAQQVSDGTLVGAQLNMPRYDTYSDVALDLINSVGIALNPIYPSTESGSTGFEYTITRISGGGQTVPGDGSYLYSSIQAGAAAALPDTWANVGHFTQNGERVLTTTLTITQRDGSNFPDQNYYQYDGSGLLIDTTGFGLFFTNTSDTYLQVGAKPSDMTNWLGFSPMGNLCGLGSTTAPPGTASLGGMWGSISASGPTLTISITQRCPIVLVPSPLIYLRTNLMSQNYACSNLNERNATPDPSDLEQTNVFAVFPIQNDIIFFQESNNAHPTFFLDTQARTISSLELFLTDRHGNTDFRLFPLHNVTSFTSNLSFIALLRLQVIERAVVPSPLSVAEYEGQEPARLASGPLIRETKNHFLNNPTTRLARR